MCRKQMALLNLSCEEKQTDDIRQFSELLSSPTVIRFELKQLLTVLCSQIKKVIHCASVTFSL